MEPLDCTGCDWCCRFMTFVIGTKGLTKDQAKKKMAYFQTHGCHIEQVLGDTNCFAVVVPTPCAQLKEDGVGCRIHSIRPDICRNYDCRKDSYLPEGGKYNGG